MQNLLAAILPWMMRILRTCRKQLTGFSVLPHASGETFGNRLLALSVNLDSAQLDVVSRSTFWGVAVPTPQPAAAAICSPMLIGKALPARCRSAGRVSGPLRRIDN